MMKTVLFGANPVDTLIDTGSDLNLLREDVYGNLAIKPPITFVQMPLSGIGNSNISTIGSVSVNITVDNIPFFVQMHIIKNSCMPVPAILGKEFLMNADVHINQNGVTITKLKTAESTEINSLMCCLIDPELSKIPEPVQQLIENYQPKQNVTTIIETNIIVKDDIPVYQRPRRLSPSEKIVVQNQIESWLKDGIISPSASQYASPIVLVKKKDNSMRLCIDYRKLNQKVIKDRYPMPNMEEQLDLLQNAKVYSTIDLENGFFYSSSTACFSGN